MCAKMLFLHNNSFNNIFYQCEISLKIGIMNVPESYTRSGRFQRTNEALPEIKSKNINYMYKNNPEELEYTFG